MAKVEIPLSPADGTSADFRAWVTAFLNALTTVGLVRVPFPGEINEATVGTQNAAPNGVAGAAVLRFDDSLQGTKPVFLKFEFGHSDSSNAGPGQLWVTVGTGHDGDGSLTGNQSPRVALGVGITNPTSPTLTLGGDKGRLSFVWAGTTMGTQAWTAVLLVERDHVADGGDSDYGITVAGSTATTSVSTTGFYSVFVPYGEATPVPETRWAAPTSTNNPSSHANAVGLGLLIPFYGAARRPALGVGIYRSNDFVPGAVFTIRAYEKDVLYRAVRAFTTNQQPVWQPDVGIAVRID